MNVSDYFAELYVAGRFADAGWNVYFPHRDKGFDFIVSKPHPDVGQLIRPVQVKGKYPTAGKGKKVTYGYVGRLTQTHPEMVLAIPFFGRADQSTPPVLHTCRCLSFAGTNEASDANPLRSLTDWPLLGATTDDSSMRAE